MRIKLKKNVNKLKSQKLKIVFVVVVEKVIIRSKK